MFNIFGLRVSQRHTKHLKALLRKMSKSELQKFLIFITAQSALPTGTKKIRISKTSSTTSCPVAHTCFNRLDLPDYNDTETLSRMLRISLDNLDADSGLHGVCVCLCVCVLLCVLLLAIIVYIYMSMFFPSSFLIIVDGRLNHHSSSYSSSSS